MRHIRPVIVSIAMALVLFFPPASLAVSEDLRELLRELLIQMPAREVSAPPFSLADTNGALVRLDGHRGHAVMIYFWTTY